MIPLYSISNLHETLEDVYSRGRLVQDFKKIIDKRIKLERDYSLSLKDLINCPEFKKAKKETTASDLYFNSLINAFIGEASNAENYVRRLEQEVQAILHSKVGEYEAETKLVVGGVRNLTKEFEACSEGIERVRSKYTRKMAELRRSKEEYMVGFLGDMPIDKKIRLFLKIKEIEERDSATLTSDFEKSAKNYNDFIEEYAVKLKGSIRRLEDLEQSKADSLKNIFIAHQIAGSEYGANLIQDNSGILSKLNKMAKQHPDFLTSSDQDFEREQKELRVPFQVDHEYIHCLFSRMINSEQTKDLIKLGVPAAITQQKELYRDNLHSVLMNNVELIQNGIEPTSEYRKFQEVGVLFKSIFGSSSEEEEEEPDSQETMWVRTTSLQQLMINEPFTRRFFIDCLQKFRRVGKFQIEGQKIPFLRSLLDTFLTMCESEKDTYNSKLLMVLSFTYYTVKEGSKVPLQSLIKDHGIWKDRDWWECALIESVFEELKVKSKKAAQNMIRLDEIKGSGQKHYESEHELTFQNIIFNQIVFYLHNMRLFLLCEHQITLFVRKYSRYFGLNQLMTADLEGMLVVKESKIEGLEQEPKSVAISSAVKNSLQKIMA